MTACNFQTTGSAEPRAVFFYYLAQNVGHYSQVA